VTADGGERRLKRGPCLGGGLLGDPSNMKSTSVSCARRLAIAPLRNVVSRTAVVSTWSATSAMGERGKLVRATVVAPLRRAWASVDGVS
jgi:hypothetical protein